MRKNPINLLLIDDDEINNFLTRELISLYCTDILVESNLFVGDALKQLKSNIANNAGLPDVILVDINMPILSGWDFIEEFEKLDTRYTQNTDIYIYTSSVYFEDINKSKTYRSVKNIFSKPLTQEMVDECCGKR